MRFAIVILALAAAACSQPSSPAPTATATPASDANSPITEVTGRAPAGVLVTLEPPEPLPIPQGEAVMDQFSKAFVPETLFVRVGQPVLFKNSEDQQHNVTVVRARTGVGVFAISQNQGDTHRHVFPEGGEYEVTCDVHPGMRATIVATTTPHAAFVDSSGAFTIRNVTPGSYTLRVWAEGRILQRRVEIKGAKMDIGKTAAP
jgi:plastocyanin